MKTYMLRTCKSNGMSSHNFRYPLEVGAFVECPDWDDNPDISCGKGLHGIPNGIGDSNYLSNDCDDILMIIETKNALPPIDGKARFKNGTIIFVERLGNPFQDTLRKAAKKLVELGCPRIGIIGDVVISGNAENAISGGYGISKSGYAGTSKTGHNGIAISGRCGTSISSGTGLSMSGDYGISIITENGFCKTGLNGMLIYQDYGKLSSLKITDNTLANKWFSVKKNKLKLCSKRNQNILNSIVNKE